MFKLLKISLLKINMHVYNISGFENKNKELSNIQKSCFPPNGHEHLDIDINFGHNFLSAIKFFLYIYR